MNPGIVKPAFLNSVCAELKRACAQAREILCHRSLEIQTIIGVHCYAVKFAIVAGGAAIGVRYIRVLMGVAMAHHGSALRLHIFYHADHCGFGLQCYFRAKTIGV